MPACTRQSTSEALHRMYEDQGGGWIRISVPVRGGSSTRRAGCDGFKAFSGQLFPCLLGKGG
eukprot:766603-Hanusia_phi.AAC.4